MHEKNRPCRCDKAKCGLCIRWYTSERHRVAWGGPREAPPLPEWWTNPEAVPVPASIEAQKGGKPKYYGLECIYRGEPTGEETKCRACVSKMIPLYSCSIHGECVTEALAEKKVAYCRTCKEKKRPPKEGV